MELPFDSAITAFCEHEAPKEIRKAIADADEAVYGLFPLSDGGTLMALGINQAELALLTLEGQVRAVTDPPANFSVNGLTAFDDGYLALSRRNNTVIEFGADLELVEDFEFANTGPENPRALVWLHTP